MVNAGFAKEQIYHVAILKRSLRKQTVDSYLNNVLCNALTSSCSSLVQSHNSK